uniref:SFRICE_012300 n=1 Tax=Spodoptera frugiperda TaxID=7108 RepID=A0A2H1VU28_SPOFR
MAPAQSKRRNGPSTVSSVFAYWNSGLFSYSDISSATSQLSRTTGRGSFRYLEVWRKIYKLHRQSFYPRGGRQRCTLWHGMSLLPYTRHIYRLRALRNFRKLENKPSNTSSDLGIDPKAPSPEHLSAFFSGNGAKCLGCLVPHHLMLTSVLEGLLQERHTPLILHLTKHKCHLMPEEGAGCFETWKMNL